MAAPPDGLCELHRKVCLAVEHIRGRTASTLNGKTSIHRFGNTVSVQDFFKVCMNLSSSFNTLDNVFVSSVDESICVTVRLVDGCLRDPKKRKRSDGDTHDAQSESSTPSPSSSSRIGWRRNDSHKSRAQAKGVLNSSKLRIQISDTVTSRIETLLERIIGIRGTRDEYVLDNIGISISSKASSTTAAAAAVTNTATAPTVSDATLSTQRPDLSVIIRFVGGLAIPLETLHSAFTAAKCVDGLFTTSAWTTDDRTLPLLDHTRLAIDQGLRPLTLVMAVNQKE